MSEPTAPRPGVTGSKRPPEHTGSYQSTPSVEREDGGDLKRRKVSLAGPMGFDSRPASSSTPPPLVPPIPLLYHLALSAHHAVHRHLQQLFIPAEVDCDPNAGLPLITSDARATLPFTHDPEAGLKALSLLLIALDFLRAGLASRDLSDRERVAFGLEFGVIGVKVLATTRTGGVKGNIMEYEVDTGRLFKNVQDAVGTAVSAMPGESLLICSSYRRRSATHTSRQ